MAVLIKSGNSLIPVGNSFSLAQGILDDDVIQRKVVAFSGSYINSTVSYIGSWAFYKSSTLTNITCTACSQIEQEAFRYCSALVTASFPACTRIGTYAFNSCTALVSAYFPACINIAGGFNFEGCSALTTLSFPMCQYIGNGAFSACAFSSIFLPECRSLDGYAFYACKALKVIYLPRCQHFGYAGTFEYCYNLLSLYLLTSTVPTLATLTIFASTPISNYTASTGGVYGSIFVRASLLTAFQTAANWSNYSARIVGLTDEQIANLQL